MHHIMIIEIIRKIPDRERSCLAIELLEVKYSKKVSNYFDITSLTMVVVQWML